MKLLSTKEIKKISGFGPETLRAYVKAGWLSAPEFKSFGRYGASLYWPELTVYRLLTIINLKKIGYKNEAINQILKGVTDNV